MHIGVFLTNIHKKILSASGHFLWTTTWMAGTLTLRTTFAEPEHCAPSLRNYVVCSYLSASVCGAVLVLSTYQLHELSRWSSEPDKPLFVPHTHLLWARPVFEQWLWDISLTLSYKWVSAMSPEPRKSEAVVFLLEECDRGLKQKSPGRERKSKSMCWTMWLSVSKQGLEKGRDSLSANHCRAVSFIKHLSLRLLQNKDAPVHPFYFRLI